MDKKTYNLFVWGSLVAVLLLLAYRFLRKKKLIPTLKAGEFNKYTLIKKDQITFSETTPNTWRFRFELPSARHYLGLPVGQHIVLKFTDDKGKDVFRSYTPISGDDALGFFELVVKIYPMGKMSQYLVNMKVGESIEVKGPTGRLDYKGQGRFLIKRLNKETKKTETQDIVVKNLGLIAGGSGLTPMLQIAQAITRNPADTTKSTLIFANVSEQDIIVRKELEEMQEKHSNFKLWLALDKPPEGWKSGKGFVNAEMIKSQCPPPSTSDADRTLICVCGPPRMLEFVKSQLVELKYPEEQIFLYEEY